MESQQQVMLGNEAIARGLLEAGCEALFAYPGTPSSEILPAFVKQAAALDRATHAHWSVNEKIALESAFTTAITGLSAAAVMKQVGLNVAADALLSTAYLGVVGGLVVVSADDPGPNSSQTEQDSRMFAQFAKVPVFDPATPQEARDFAGRAMDLSKDIGLPVLLRPTATLCHARQNLALRQLDNMVAEPEFIRQPERWAATPRHRLRQHHELNRKLLELAANAAFDFSRPHDPATAGAANAVIASGVAWAATADLLMALPPQIRAQIALYKVDLPFPLHLEAGRLLRRRHRNLLVIEETMPVIEYQLGERERIHGRLDGSLPDAGALKPEIIAEALEKSFELPRPPQAMAAAADPGRRPSLCPGCPHRSSFYALKQALPKGIYAGDIGCYTLGLNLKALDTCLCMGASISQAGAFYQSFARHRKENPPPVAAIIGDSTFFHSGLPALVNARWEGSRFVLLILDNNTTAMTGNQPTPATGRLADGSQGTPLALERVLAGCGLDWIETVDPYNQELMTDLLRSAWQYCQSEDGGIAAVIARRDCLMLEKRPSPAGRRRVFIDADLCSGCNRCRNEFECPALVSDASGEHVTIDQLLCTACGQCLICCPEKAIKITGEES